MKGETVYTGEFLEEFKEEDDPLDYEDEEGEKELNKPFILESKIFPYHIILE